MKAVLPSRRTKKRFIVFRLENEIKDPKEARNLIYGQLKYCLGILGLAKVGYMFLNNKFDGKYGIFKIDTKSLLDVKMSLLLAKDKLKIIGVSGMINKCQRFIDQDKL